MKVSAVVKHLPNTTTNGGAATGDALAGTKRPASDSERTPLPVSAKKPRTVGSAKTKGKGKAKPAEELKEDEGDDKPLPIKDEGE